MTDTLDALEAFLTQYGWCCERLGDDAIVTGFADEQDRRYAISLAAGEKVVTMTTAFQLDELFVDEKMLWTFLEFSGALPWAKLGADAEHNLLLAVDCPLEGLSYKAFALAMDTMCDAAQLLVDKLRGVVK